MLPEVMDPEDLAVSGDGPGGPGGDANRNLAALFSGLDNDNLHQLKLDLAKADPENADRIKHLIAKKVSYHITHHLSSKMDLERPPTFVVSTLYLGEKASR